jgi:tRNA (guanine37-N1)-methyltransferase
MPSRTSKFPSFREALRARLSLNEQKQAIYSFDVLGDLALIEIPRALSKKRVLIGKTLLETNPRVKKVFEKVGEHEGKFRVEKIKWICGEKNSETIYTEWGCTFHVDPHTVFFNPRLGSERQRVCSFVKKNQTVAVFFGGVGPYAIEIAKHAHPVRVFSIEWNPAAKPFLLENISRNKVSSIVEPLFGDVKKISPRGVCDHVIMPAPDTAVDFLPAAVKWLSKKGGLIHCYTFVSTENPEKEAAEKVRAALGEKNPFKIVFVRKVSDFSARKWQVCVGVKVSIIKRKKSR